MKLLPSESLQSKPVEGAPLNVALVYNLKPASAGSGSGGKEEHTTDSSEDPPSTGQEKSEDFTLPSLSASHHDDTYAEWDTAETIEAIRAALQELHTVTLIEADDRAYSRLADLRPDIVFNIAEGLHGVSREAQIPTMLEFLGIPYTGSDPLTLATCLDKARTKEVLAHHGIPTPRFSLVSTVSELAGISTKFPCIVKPAHEGSSKGIYDSSVVENWEGLCREVKAIIETYKEPALVEEYLEGREFTAAMLGNGDDIHVLPIVEIAFDSLPKNVRPIYSYEAKWIWDRAESPLDIFECPARIPAALRHELETMCEKAFRLLRCRDWCRIDLRLDAADRPRILELNPLPGILPRPEDNSCFPKAARAAGMTYNQLVQAVLHTAAGRYGILRPSAEESRVA